MSMTLHFEPHSWYREFAIEKTGIHKKYTGNYPWNAYMDDGMRYQVIEINAATLKDLKQQIRAFWHVRNNVPF